MIQLTRRRELRQDPGIEIARRLGVREEGPHGWSHARIRAADCSQRDDLVRVLPLFRLDRLLPELCLVVNDDAVLGIGLQQCVLCVAERDDEPVEVIARFGVVIPGAHDLPLREPLDDRQEERRRIHPELVDRHRQRRHTDLDAQGRLRERDVHDELAPAAGAFQRGGEVAAREPHVVPPRTSGIVPPRRDLGPGGADQPERGSGSRNLRVAGPERTHPRSAPSPTILVRAKTSSVSVDERPALDAHHVAQTFLPADRRARPAPRRSAASKPGAAMMLSDEDLVGRLQHLGHAGLRDGRERPIQRRCEARRHRSGCGPTEAVPEPMAASARRRSRRGCAGTVVAPRFDEHSGRSIATIARVEWPPREPRARGSARRPPWPRRPGSNPSMNVPVRHVSRTFTPVSTGCERLVSGASGHASPVRRHPASDGPSSEWPERPQHLAASATFVHTSPNRSSTMPSRPGALEHRLVDVRGLPVEQRELDRHAIAARLLRWMAPRVRARTRRDGRGARRDRTPADGDELQLDRGESRTSGSSGPRFCHP